MAKKDPAFLFYSKDWLEGTAEMLPQEKGVYIDLLCHQHQKGDLPSDTLRLARITGLAHEDFLPIWEHLSDKFEPIGTPNGGRICNKKLCEVATERSSKAWKNKIISVFAAVIKKNRIDASDLKKLKESFKVDDFIHCTTENITERITEWCTVRIGSLANANANEDVNENKGEEGVGETQPATPMFHATHSTQLLDIDLLLQKVIHDIDGFVRIYAQQGIDKDKLELWLENFNKWLRFTGCSRKLERDYRTHFGNWLPTQDLTTDPKIYQPTKINGNGNTNKRNATEKSTAATNRGL